MKTLASLLALAAVVGIVAPGVIIAYRIANDDHMLGQLVAGLMVVCGGSGAILAALVGAGLFARLAGWRAPSHSQQIIEVQRPELPTAQPAPMLPPWGVTGGGALDLLPEPRQDTRFTYTVETPMASTGEE